MKPLLLLLLLGACSTTPRRVVIQDDPVFSTHALSAIDEFEGILECRIWETVEVGGDAWDWYGNYPPFGTVTVERNPLKLPADIAGRAHSTHIGHRTRIYIRDVDPAKVVVIHELLHAMGFKHDDSGLMNRKKEKATLLEAYVASPLSTKVKMRGLCLYED